jgi:hypothetical protein
MDIMSDIRCMWTVSYYTARSCGEKAYLSLGRREERRGMFVPHQEKGGAVSLSL